METPYTCSSLDSRYDDGVYDKVEAQSHDRASREPIVKPPRLPAVMLVTLVLLFVSCFVGLLISGLHFGHRVPSDESDCLGQSWVMFSVRGRRSGVAVAQAGHFSLLCAVLCCPAPSRRPCRTETSVTALSCPAVRLFLLVNSTAR